MHFTLHVAKGTSSQTLRSLWVVADDVVFLNLTELATESRYEVSVPIIVGTELKSGEVPVKNTIRVTFSDGGYGSAVVYCADQPDTMITLEGYDAKNPQFPLIVPLSEEAE